MKKFRKILAIVAGCSIFAATSASAATVTFEFVSTVRTSGIPGVAAGDDLVFRVFADNGGSSLASQSWSGLNYLGATADVGNGAYTASFDSTLFFSTSFSASTDALGNVSAFSLNDATSGNTDSLGGRPQFILNGARTNLFTGFYLLDAVDLTAPENFTARVGDLTAVPLPAGLPLLAFGLVGSFALIRRRKPG